MNLLVDFLFIDVLSAPPPDELKAISEESQVKRHMRRVSNAVRRVSAATIQSVNAIRKSVERKTSKKIIQVDTTRVVPDSTADAQILAVHSIGNLLKESRGKIDSGISLRKSQRSQSLVERIQDRQEKKAKISSIRVSETAAPTKQDLDNAKISGIGEAKLREIFAELIVDMMEQRKALKRGMKESFDAMWGYVNIYYNLYMHLLTVSYAELTQQGNSLDSVRLYFFASTAIEAQKRLSNPKSNL